MSAPTPKVGDGGHHLAKMTARKLDDDGRVRRVGHRGVAER